jgi:hypothetical protein
MMTRVGGQIGLHGSTRLIETATQSLVILARLRKIQLTWKTGLCKTRGAENRKKEKVLLRAKGQLHGGAQGVLPRHKNADCKRFIKESWPRKKKEERDY